MPASSKLVWLKNANFLADTPLGRSTIVQGALEQLAELLNAGLPPDVTLLISATETDKRRSFYKGLQKVAEGWDRRPSNAQQATVVDRGTDVLPKRLVRAP